MFSAFKSPRPQHRTSSESISYCSATARTNISRPSSNIRRVSSTSRKELCSAHSNRRGRSTGRVRKAFHIARQRRERTSAAHRATFGACRALREKNSVQRIQIAEAAAQDEFGKHFILLGNGANEHQPPIEQHSARVEHFAKRTLS